MRKQLATLIIVALLCGIFSLGTSKAQGSQIRVISTATTWTAGQNPYMLSGTVTVAAGATLTIEPGVTVYLNGGCLQVDGTLRAKGTNENQVRLSNGEIKINGPGTAIENALLFGMSIFLGNSAMVNNNTMTGEFRGAGGSIIVQGGDPAITRNTITGSGYPRSIYIYNGSPTIKENYMVGGIWSDHGAKHAIIEYNTIYGPVVISGGTPEISHNTILGRPAQYFGGNDTLPGGSTEITGGIGMTGYNFGEDKLYNAIVTDNTIIGGVQGIGWNAGPGATIKNNLIMGFTREAIALGSNAVVKDNTVTNNTAGIRLFNFNGADLGGAFSPPSIIGNNIFNNSEFNVYSNGGDLAAPNNWWGAADEAAIEQTIHDHTFDSYAGELTVKPYLTQPNPNAYPSGTPPTQPSEPTEKNTPSPLQTPNPNYFQVESNSTVSALSFNGISSEISFTLSGPEGTTGYVNATIAKDFMPNGNSLKVYIDDNLINCTINQNENSWIISFTYHHSTHQVRISQTQTPQPLQVNIWAVAITGVIILLVLIPVAFIAVRLKKAKAKTP